MQTASGAQEQPRRHPAGLLLLTGGAGRRLGEAKHGLPHPLGGSWGGRLVAVFAAVFPGCPVTVLGEPLPDRPELTPCPDPRQGPAQALIAWARQGPDPAVRRWWVVACDQVCWTPAALETWHARADAADPEAGHWVLAVHGGRRQWLGGFLAGSLLPGVAEGAAGSLWGLAETLPTLELDADLHDPRIADPWLDVDTPAALRAWLESVRG